ncbi:gustatory receptor for sugar taste 64f-like [Sitodiplosis mosellana]|uniref:gustatory receptor for sugar taste 64f-like n=1 Tax=Sitodiplosis mosellana TaxID=263140 RepID=UPI002444DB61|nr:gustatory receptor for sugar taste 64f-like [Sitodiplosis mosellana]
MVISIGLSTQFRLFNSELRQTVGQHMSTEYWVYRREQYRRLRYLVNIVDRRISHIIFVSFSNNIFTICQQLFSSLRSRATVYRLIYFWYSLLFLLMRAFLVSFTAAGINDESTKPIRILRSVSSYSWNTETKRFLDEVKCGTVALSGMKFFYLTRKMILSVASTIVTYELVMMQFHIGLSTMFKLYNEDLKRTNGENKSREYWIYRRSQYGKLRDLVTMVDEKVTECTMIAFSNDLFFICKQLFLAFRPMPTYVHMFYFWFSIVFLILRAVAVSLSAAHIHDASKQAINILYAVPSHLWNTETKRFVDEVNGKTIALSGMNFFFFTRKLILSAAGMILTYELVLLQLQSNTTPDQPCDTAFNRTL